MEISDVDYISRKLQQFKAELQIDIFPDWGKSSDGSWQAGTWAKDELDRLHDFIDILSGAMGGSTNFIKNIGGVLIKKEDIGSHGGEAMAHLVRLSQKGSFNAWTVVHEFAHAWDANHDWQLSVKLENYTGGYTSLLRSFLRRLIGPRDSGLWNSEDLPGRRGRLPGCNAVGYFYGDKPSGSNWAFNRKEDFAESVAMYVGWKRNNELSAWAEARVNRYLLENGANAQNFGVDNWADYKKYFYPENGDYTKTKRWQFVDELMNGKI